MSRNGSGVYSLPGGSAITNGDTSDASDLNTPLNDIAADLNIARPIVAGGTSATSASAARTALGVPGAAETATISGAWTYSADVIFNDSVEALFGTGSDFSIQHDGTNTKLVNSTGVLTLQGATVRITNEAATEVLANFVADAAATLYYDGSTKLATASGGVNVTGAMAASGAVSGTTGTFTGALSGATVAGAMLQDDDTFASPAANKVASSESVKAYVDATPRPVAWGLVATSVGATVNDSYGITSVSDDGTGLFTINLTSTMAGTGYARIIQAYHATKFLSWIPTGTTTTSLQIQFKEITTGTNTDPAAFSIVIFGDLA